MVDGSRPAGPRGVTGGKPAAANESYRRGPTMQQVKTGRHSLKRGHSGPGVRELQVLLNDAGRPVPVNGLFGAETEAAVRELQKQAGMKVDGTLAIKTLAALTHARAARRIEKYRVTIKPFSPSPAAGSPLAPGLQAPGRSTSVSAGQPLPLPVSASSFASEPGRVTGPFAAETGARESQAEAILKANGVWPPQEGRIYAIQIDQDSPPPTASRDDRLQYVKSYTGQTAVFQARAGRLVQVGDGLLRSASHAASFSSSEWGVDVNRDGQRDMGHLHTGVYEYNVKAFKDRGRRRMNPTASAAVGRDINHDGVIDGAKESKRYIAGGIQIHESGANSSGSAGCQTLPPSDFAQLERAVGFGPQRVFTYVLVRRPNDRFGEHRF